MDYMDEFKLKSKIKKDNICLDIILPVLLLLLAFIFRYWNIKKANIGNDECFSLYYSQYSFEDIKNVLIMGDNPPLWEWILSLWVGIFGIGLLSLRSLSLLFNVLTIIPLYKLANSFFSRRIALGASLLYVFSSFSLFLSHDGRVYSLVGFLAVGSFYLFMKQFMKPVKYRWLHILVSNVLLVYSHYIAAFWIIVMEIFVVLLFTDLRKAMWKGLLFTVVGILVFCFPLIPIIFDRFMDSGLNGTWIEKCHGIEELYSMLCAFTNAPVPTALAIIIMVSALIKLASTTSINKLKLSPSLLVFLFWLIPLLLSFFLSFFIGFFLNRYFYFLLPFYLLSLVVCVDYLFVNKKFSRILTEFIFLIIIIFSFKMDSSVMRYAGWKGDVSKVANRLIELKKENSCVIISPYWIDKQLVYYFDEKHTIFANEGNLTEPVFSEYLKNKGFYYDMDYNAIDYSKYPTIIIVHENWKDVSSIINNLVNQGYVHDGSEIYQQLTIDFFCKQ